MKNFITIIASIIILMAFLLQFVSNQIIYTRIMGIDTTVRTFARNAEQSDTIAAFQIAELREKLASVSGTLPDNINIVISNTCAQTAQPQSKEYTVVVPLKNLILGGKLLGIRDNDNCLNYTVRGTIIHKAYISENGSDNQEEDFQ